MGKVNSIGVVFSSKKNEIEIKPYIEHLNATVGCEAHIYYIFNPNGMSLSRIYGDAIDSNTIAAQKEVLVFIHDDIEFLRSGWGAEILRLFNEHEDYGIIGVAGSAQFDENAMWWNYDKKYGQVLHKSEGKSWLTAFSPLLKEDLKEVAVIDGLFMAVHRNRIGANFDKNLEGFDFYDINFCLANLIEGRSKIGVTTNIRIAHKSVGKLKDSWYTNKDIINNRYEKYYPIDITKNKDFKNKRKWNWKK